MVSVKDTRCGREICSLWGSFCSFNVKVQKCSTKSWTEGFSHILDVMEPCGQGVFFNIRIKIQHKNCAATITANSDLLKAILGFYCSRNPVKSQL